MWCRSWISRSAPKGSRLSRTVSTFHPVGGISVFAHLISERFLHERRGERGPLVQHVHEAAHSPPELVGALGHRVRDEEHGPDVPAPLSVEVQQVGALDPDDLAEPAPRLDVPVGGSLAQDVPERVPRHVVSAAGCLLLQILDIRSRVFQEKDLLAPGEHRQGRIEIGSGAHVDPAHRGRNASLETTAEIVAHEADDQQIDLERGAVIEVDVHFRIELRPWRVGIAIHHHPAKFHSCRTRPCALCPGPRGLRRTKKRLRCSHGKPGRHAETARNTPVQRDRAHIRRTSAQS